MRHTSVTVGSALSLALILAASPATFGTPVSTDTLYRRSSEPIPCDKSESKAVSTQKKHEKWGHSGSKPKSVPSPPADMYNEPSKDLMPSNEKKPESNMNHDMQDLSMWDCEEVIEFPADEWDCEATEMSKINLDEYDCWEETDFSGYDCEEAEGEFECDEDDEEPIEKSGPSAPAETLASVPSIPTSAPKSPEPVSESPAPASEPPAPTSSPSTSINSPITSASYSWSPSMSSLVTALLLSASVMTL
ncbi:hypothetical protein BASA50_005119 [Batrachochytrium salamandrivorans]|uniref:Uncharacterized protein n=1 Tax=Batrachochytrium salamandrivorans TaxID=1357716 RepID=A0ABQ8FDI8_9FUNG|nr:hypothetical protein BASA50_005119 [Batrachochytrium salamandrivorans]